MRLAKEAREIITTLEENRSLQRSIERVVERENYEWQTLSSQKSPALEGIGSFHSRLASND